MEKPSKSIFVYEVFKAILMPTYKLFAQFEVEDSGEIFIRSIEENIESTDIKTADQVFEGKISEMVSDFSQRGLNWTLLEKCITTESGEIDIPENNPPEKQNSGSDFTVLML